jgi:hypothetical protein
VKSTARIAGATISGLIPPVSFTDMVPPWTRHRSDAQLFLGLPGFTVSFPFPLWRRFLGTRKASPAASASATTQTDLGALRRRPLPSPCGCSTATRTDRFGPTGRQTTRPRQVERPAARDSFRRPLRFEWGFGVERLHDEADSDGGSRAPP